MSQIRYERVCRVCELPYLAKIAVSKTCSYECHRIGESCRVDTRIRANSDKTDGMDIELARQKYKKGVKADQAMKNFLLGKPRLKADLNES